MPSFALSLAPEDVRVWYASSGDLAGSIARDRALAWLSADERERYERFHADDDRRMFLLGRVMARLLVGRALDVTPTAWQWREGPHGRPEIAAPETTVQFNLAHSAGVVVCALARGRDVGVDVEHLDRRPVDPAVVQRYCAPEEVADITAQGDAWHDRFLRYWTLKEAYLKACGLGIAVTLGDIAFSHDDEHPRVAFRGSLRATHCENDRWAFHLDRPAARHLIAVAASVADGLQPRFSLERLDVTPFL